MRDAMNIKSFSSMSIMLYNTACHASSGYYKNHRSCSKLQESGRGNDGSFSQRRAKHRAKTTKNTLLTKILQPSIVSGGSVPSTP
jgi:hypothetical protein